MTVNNEDKEKYPFHWGKTEWANLKSFLKTLFFYLLVVTGMLAILWGMVELWIR